MWKDVSIGDVCEVIAGQSPEGKYYNSDGKGLAFYQGKKDFGEKHIGVPTKWTTQVTKEAQAGDILMSVRAPVGPINFATERVCIGRGLAAIRPSSKVNKDFLFYGLLEKQKEICGNEGAVFASINKAQISAINFPLPPLEKQKRIVAILDEAFEGIDQAIANTEKNIQNTKELFESYLNNIFTQKGEGWVEDKLINLTFKIGSGATPKGGSNSYKDEGISLIRSMNVYDRLFKAKKLAFIDDEQAEKLSNVVVEVGDVLFNITGASVARCCLVPDEYLPARVNQHVSILRPNTEKLSSEFLCYLMTSRPYKERLLGIGEEGGSTRQAITKAQLQQLVVSFPEDVQHQKNVIDYLNKLELQAKQIETICLKKLNALKELKQSLLQKAFSGELTSDMSEVA